jgi:hypothetical protein
MECKCRIEARDTSICCRLPGVDQVREPSPTGWAADGHKPRREGVGGSFHVHLPDRCEQRTAPPFAGSSVHVDHMAETDGCDVSPRVTREENRDQEAGE